MVSYLEPTDQSWKLAGPCDLNQVLCHDARLLTSRVEDADLAAGLPTARIFGNGKRREEMGGVVLKRMFVNKVKMWLVTSRIVFGVALIEMGIPTLHTT